jgi:hypothetical protein
MSAARLALICPLNIDFVAAVEIGAKTAGQMLDEIEQKHVDSLLRVDRDQSFKGKS